MTSRKFDYPCRMILLPIDTAGRKLLIMYSAFPCRGRFFYLRLFQKAIPFCTFEQFYLCTKTIELLGAVAYKAAILSTPVPIPLATRRAATASCPAENEFSLHFIERNQIEYIFKF